MRSAGVELVEVGTTNRTHLRDYSAAVTDRTALILVVHTSNYRIEGFTTRPSLNELAGIARDKHIPLVHDVGSGLLEGSIGDEPTVADSLHGNADLVLFSGDKLFGGPQAGMIVGREDLVGKLARHPIARAVRIDKLTLAALEATLLAHLTGRRAELPTWQAMDLTPEQIGIRARRVAERLGAAASVRPGTSVAGGGSMPGEGMPSMLVDVNPDPMRDTVFLARMRAADPPVIARTEKGRIVLDLRTVPAEQDEQLAHIITTVLKEQ